MNSKIYVLIIIVLICVFYFYYKKSKNYLIKGVKDSTQEVVLSNNNINTFKNGFEYTYCIWMYIEDWDYKYGQPKHVMSMGTKDLKTCTPGIFLNPKENRLDVIVDIHSSHRFYNRLKNKDIKPKKEYTSVNDPDLCMNLCTKEENCKLAAFDKHNKKCYMYENDETVVSDKEKLDIYAKKKFSSDYDKLMARKVVSIDSIPLQRWFNLSLVLNDRILHLYLDGKLIKSVEIPGIPIHQGNKVYVNLDGGFKGNVSDLIYHNTALSANEIYSQYRYGISNQYYKDYTNNKGVLDYNMDNIPEIKKEYKGYVTTFFDILGNLF